MRKTILTLLTVVACSSLNALSTYSFFNDVHVNGEFLWWRGRNDKLNTVLNTQNTNLADSTWQTRPYTYGWDPGFRVGIDTQFCLGEKSYSTFATFTYFRGNDNQDLQYTRALSSQIFTFSTPLSSVASQALGSSVTFSGSTDFLYERLDVGFAKSIDDCRIFAVIPKVAFSYIHTHQYMYERFTIITPTTPRNTFTQAKNRYDGYGLMIGMDSFYRIISGFSVYGMFEVAGYLGEQTYSNEFVRRSLPTNAVVETLDNHFNGSCARWLADMRVGLQYEEQFFGCLQMAGRIGWEFLYLPNQTIGSFSYIAEDMKISGLVLGLEIGF